jgi:hypothetical protein
MALLLLTVGPVGKGWAEDVNGTKTLLTITRRDLATILPPDCRILITPSSIEQFLDALDGIPPDWGVVYGHGHHDPEHNERLFALNRERDAKREGKDALQWTVVFLWSGELSRYEPTIGGFSIAMGPIFTPTRWGLVRFKAEDLPGNLFAIPESSQLDSLRQQVEAGQTIDIEIAMMGRLIPEESLVYDFSHEEEGRGLIMPVVRIERVEYLLAR